MKNRFTASIVAVRDRFRKWMDAVRDRWNGWRLTQPAMSRIGWYGALVLLLLLLGSASYAYRARRHTNTATPTEPPGAAISVQAPIFTPRPEPTAEPVRWQWPLEGEIVGDYSPSEPVWAETLGQWQTHPALDIAGSPGEAVYACREGTVRDAWTDRLWGNVIVLDHGDGYISTCAGLNTLKMVAVGQAVEAGQVIGSVGQSAACEAELGWHLHFELTRNGEPVDFEELAKEGE